MASRKKCASCGAGNDGEATTCSLCGKPLQKKTMEAFELEPRQWTGASQRRRGDKDEAPAGHAPAVAPRSEAASALPAASSEAMGEGHYLLPPVGPPLKLEPNIQSFVFGRDETCGVRIVSAKVSRRHAELRWRGNPPQLVLRDLNSQNGTFLNDKKMIEEVALADGDTIRMGDYIASYRLLETGEDPNMLAQRLNDTAVMETVVVAYGDAHPAEDVGGLQGDAAILPIHEVLRRLLALHAHGTLSIEVSGTKGTMKIVGGHAVEGSYAGLDGTHAVQAMSSLAKGHFRFDPDPHAPAMHAPPQTGRFEKPIDGAAHAQPTRTPSGPMTAPKPGAPPPGARPGAGAPPPRPGGPGGRPAAPPTQGPRPAPKPPG